MKKGFLALTAIFASSTSAFAIDLTFSGVNNANPQTARISVNGSQFTSVYAGELRFNSAGGSIYSYCADALSTLNSAAHSYDFSQLAQSTSTGLGKAATILANHQGMATSSAQQAGLQLAIWEALYDGGATFDASGACFRAQGVSDEALCFASEYYGSINRPSNNGVVFYQTNEVGGQSQMTAVPEPMTLASLGLGAVALMRRRRKQS